MHQPGYEDSEMIPYLIKHIAEVIAYNWIHIITVTTTIRIGHMHLLCQMEHARRSPARDHDFIHVVFINHVNALHDAVDVFETCGQLLILCRQRTPKSIQRKRQSFGELDPEIGIVYS